MNVIDIVLLAAVALGLFFALRASVRRKKRGGCCGSCADCGKCGSCKTGSGGK